MVASVSMTSPTKPNTRSRRAFLRAAGRAGAIALVALPTVTGEASTQPATPVATVTGFAGRVVDAATLEVVVGAVIRAQPTGSTATSDSTGWYSLTLPPGTFTVDVSRDGYIGISWSNQLVATGYTALDLTLIPEAPSHDQQILLYSRLVKQPVSPSVSSDAFSSQRLRVDGAGLPATITVNYDLANPPYTVQVPLEDYVKGVVPNEMPASWPANTLQAQAVAARSYGVAAQLANGFVYPDTRSQVYNPNYRTSATDAAVSATTSQVLTVNGSVVFAFFFSECNGSTTRNSENANAYQVDSNGYIVKNSQGQAICVTSGWSYVSYCRARSCTGHAPSTYSTCGYYGHGVGMCQWGAYYRSGLSFSAILSSFYTGVTIGVVAPAATPTPLPSPTPSPSPTPTPIPVPRPYGPFLVLAGQPITLSWAGVGGGAQYAVTLFQGGLKLNSTTTTQTSWAIGALALGTYTWTVSASVGTSASATLNVVSKIYQDTLPLVRT